VARQKTLIYVILRYIGVISHMNVNVADVNVTAIIDRVAKWPMSS